MFISLAAFQARELSEALGIPLSCVLPVKNYSEELELDLNTDLLLFSAVEQILNYADCFFENHIVEDQEVNDGLELYRSSDHLRPELSQHFDHQVVWKTVIVDHKYEMKCLVVQRTNTFYVFICQQHENKQDQTKWNMLDLLKGPMTDTP